MGARERNLISNSKTSKCNRTTEYIEMIRITFREKNMLLLFPIAKLRTFIFELVSDLTKLISPNSKTTNTGKLIWIHILRNSNKKNYSATPNSGGKS